VNSIEMKKLLVALLALLAFGSGSVATAAPLPRAMSLGDSHCANNMAAFPTMVAEAGLEVDWVGTKKDGPGPDGDNERHGGWEAGQVVGIAPLPEWEPANAPLLDMLAL
jgi:hypothetical protein